MVYEYAIDPRIFKTSEGFFAIWNQVGPENGRLISALPKNWKDIVYDTIIETLPEGDIQNKEYLKSSLYSPILRQLCCRSGINNCDSIDDWISDACKEHSKINFRGIVTNEECDCNCRISSVDAINKNSGNPHWHITTGEHPVPGSGVALAQYISSLLRLSEYVKFIDPYLNLNETDFRNPVTEIVLELLRINSIPRKYVLEFHCTDSDRSISFIDRRNGFKTLIHNLPITSKDGLSFRFKIWKMSELSKEIKDRFMVTNITGIEVSHDLRESSDGWRLKNLGPNPIIEDQIQTDKFDFKWP